MSTEVTEEIQPEDAMQFFLNALEGEKTSRLIARVILRKVSQVSMHERKYLEHFKKAKKLAILAFQQTLSLEQTIKRFCKYSRKRLSTSSFWRCRRNS